MKASSPTRTEHESTMATKSKGSEATFAPPQGKAGTITKVEAVRRALDELGTSATGATIQDFVRDRFQLPITVDHIYTTKADILRKRKEQQEAELSNTPEAEATSQPQAEPSPPQT